MFVHTNVNLLGGGDLDFEFSQSVMVDSGSDENCASGAGVSDVGDETV